MTMLAIFLLGGTIAAITATAYFKRLADSERDAKNRADNFAASERAARVEADRRALESQAVVAFLVDDLLSEAAPDRAQGKVITVGDVLAHGQLDR